jgi:hypothetical protein
MRWNSWDCYGASVTEAEVKGNADYATSKLYDTKSESFLDLT